MLKIFFLSPFLKGTDERVLLATTTEPPSHMLIHGIVPGNTENVVAYICSDSKGVKTFCVKYLENVVENKDLLQ